MIFLFASLVLRRAGDFIPNSFVNFVICCCRVVSACLLADSDVRESIVWKCSVPSVVPSFRCNCSSRLPK